MAGKAGKKGEGKASIVIKKEEVVEGGHHGGAWKVAYADFVTAMMAFFLLMWLLNATTAEQKQGIADYFSPTNIMAHGLSGNGSPFGGKTPYADGMLASDRGALAVMNAKSQLVEVDDDDSDVMATAVTYAQPGTADTPPDNAPKRTGQLRANGTGGDAAGQNQTQAQAQAQAQARAEQAQAHAEQVRKERENFQQAAQQIRDQVAADPALASLARQLSVDVTADGLRIQIMDEEKQAMFASGSAVLNERARALLLKVVPVLMRLPEKLSITGHTDASPFKGGDRTNWELSAERANATRRLFAEAGIPESRVQTVSGRADRDPLLPADPASPANRRIAIVVLRDAKPKG